MRKALRERCLPAARCRASRRQERTRQHRHPSGRDAHANRALLWSHSWDRDGGRPSRCGRRHDPDDPQLGAAIDPELYRYSEQVIWNHYAPQLWKRTMQAIRRELAYALGTPRSKLSQTARVRFAKVAEFQRRGVVHYHALIRIDGPEGAQAPPPSKCTTELLAEVVSAAAKAASIVLPEPLLGELAPGAAAKLRWGAQREVVALDRHTCTMAAGYIAKYATKATETVTGGVLIKPIRSPARLAKLQLAEHARALTTTAWKIGESTSSLSVPTRNAAASGRRCLSMR
jgi:hypothetical protein